MNGETIGKAWQAAQDRLPEGWIIDRLELHPKGMLRVGSEIVQRTNLWSVRAKPAKGFAWRNARQQGKQPTLNGHGESVVEALLDLAVRAERGPEDQSSRTERMEAVDTLFSSLFPAT